MSEVLQVVERGTRVVQGWEGGPEPFRLLHGDCLQMLAALPEASVDLIFADPPYNLSNGGSTCRSGRWSSVDKGEWDKSEGVDEDHEFNRRWLSACKRVLKPTGTVWVSGTQHVIYSIGFAMQELGYHLLNTVTWFKPNASPNLSCRYFTHSSELLLWASPERGRRLLHTFNYSEMKEENGGKQMRDLWVIPTPGKQEKRHGNHPTQKPLRLLERIVRATSCPGDLVLDPFCGSGTTGVAALENGRRFLGIERESRYVELARRRLEEATVVGPAAALAREAADTVPTPPPRPRSGQRGRGPSPRLGLA
ncbi:MAG: DNA methyltransferase [Myxococcota bacterium]|jgi:site-specific DNA-methyltransferase (adenine-specific)|nr:DNA methyltransferase [Myxococcota bacterium]